METITNEIIWERLNTFINDNKCDHEKINEHLNRLNGSVSSLKSWKGIMQGAIGVLTAIVVPICLMLFANFLDK